MKAKAEIIQENQGETIGMVDDNIAVVGSHQRVNYSTSKQASPRFLIYNYNTGKRYGENEQYTI